jgi:hypothetical protein
LLNPRPESLQYGGDVFRTASSFLQRVVPGMSTGDPDARRPALPVGIAATALLLSRLPTLTVRLSDSPAGERMRRHYSDRMWGILHSRLAQGVLALPAEQRQYLRGRSRQALRTNAHRARAAGVVCGRLEGLDRRRAAALRLRERLTGVLEWPDELFCLPGDAWWSAHAPDGDAIAFARVTVDREWAMLQSFISSDRASRYLLHAEIVETLIAANVRYLTVCAPMAPLLEAPLQYWQRLLGFRVVNLSLRGAPLPSIGPAPAATREDVTRLGDIALGRREAALAPLLRHSHDL